MDLKQIAKDTIKTLSSYLTYQALRTVMEQLRETNPPLAYWLNEFANKERIQDGEAFLEALLKEAHQDLAFRIMTVRQHLAGEISESLPESLILNIQQANMKHQRQLLERMTQLESATRPDPNSEAE